MKTLDWKTLGRRAAFIGLTSFLLVACGQENKTNSENTGNANHDGYYNPNNPYQPGGGGSGGGGTGGNYPDLPNNVNSDMQHLKSYQCPNGQRLPDIHMSVTQSSSTNTTLYGTFQSGHINGSHSATFAGMNYGTLDLVFVTKVNMGSGQVGFNFILSLCPQNNMQTGHEIIGPNTQYNSMEMIQGFNLDHDVNCAIGNVDVGGIAFTTNTHSSSHQRLFSKVCAN